MDQSPINLALYKEKRDLRTVMRERRKEASLQFADAAVTLRHQFFKSITVPKGAVVSGYIAQDGEIDPSLVMEALYERGHPLCLPVVIGKGEALEFRAYAPGDALATSNAKMPLSEPVPDAAVLEPTLLLVPLLAFDPYGGRLGFGGGFYDATLNGLRKRGKVLAVGLAYAIQEVEHVPMAEWDARLDKILTEKRVFSP